MLLVAIWPKNILDAGESMRKARLVVGAMLSGFRPWFGHLEPGRSR